MTERPPRTMPARIAAFAAVALSQACSPCASWCDAVAESYDRCLGEWGLTWSDVGSADGPDALADACREREEEARLGLSDEASSARDEACSAAVDAYAGAEDCAALAEAMASSPVVF